ncbi:MULTISPECIES: hypothetical protein [unclassified Streptomyces]|uniref:hypothetical protein n=1 Tax=unclassified Streptomyces TaxID=2593676 RepID=UPI00363C9055
MTDIVFTPTFKHTTWVDNRDRVSASGPNGFNIRFDTLQKDLESLSGVVKTIDTAIKTGGAPPVAVERKLSVAPVFSPLAGETNWELDPTGVAGRPGSSETARGIIAVTPPDGAKLLKFRALGKNTTGGSLTIALVRTTVQPAPAQEILSVVNGTGTYDSPQDIAPGKERVDMAAFRYAVRATLIGAGAGSATITSLQISYVLD